MFDFIGDEDFRKSLESDYREIESCMEIKAWKAVHVLAGSIIEALLLDYLVAIEYDKRKLSDLRLVDIIEICKKEHILNNRTADLSNVIRDYRNLIHPEKVRRLNEKVDENGAKVAEALVKIIIEDVAELRSKKIGLTAEQLITKIENDYSVSAILEHLIKNINKYEQKRLLTNVIPERYLRLLKENTQINNEYPIDIIKENLEICYHLTFNLVNDAVKKEVVREFMKVIKNEGSTKIAIYEERLFRGDYLAFFSNEDQQLFKRHFLERFSNNINDNLIKSSKGFGKFLTKSDANHFVNGFVRGITISDINTNLATEAFTNEFKKMPKAAQDASLEKLNEWIQNLDKQDLFHHARTLRELKEAINVHALFDDDFDPFLDSDDDGLPEEKTVAVPSVASNDFDPFLDSDDLP